MEFNDSTTNITNGSEFLLETASEIYRESWILNLIRVAGFLAFLLNVFILVCFVRLIKERKRENSFYVQLAYISSTDVAGWFFTNMVTIPTSNIASVYICAFSFIFLNVTSCMGQGSILVICLQRYIFAKNIRSTTLKLKRTLTKTLFTVNVIIGVHVLILNIVLSDLEVDVDALYCNRTTLHDYNKIAFTIFLVIALPTILVSDFLCGLAIGKLSKKNRQIHVQPAKDSSNISNISQREDSTIASCSTAGEMFRKSQKHAIMTIIIMLIIQNVTTLPYLLHSLLGYVNVTAGPGIERFLMMTVMGNTITNPIIYITRLHGMREMVKKDLRKLQQIVCWK